MKEWRYQIRQLKIPIVMRGESPGESERYPSSHEQWNESPQGEAEGDKTLTPEPRAPNPAPNPEWIRSGFDRFKQGFKPRNRGASNSSNVSPGARARCHSHSLGRRHWLRPARRHTSLFPLATFVSPPLPRAAACHDEPPSSSRHHLLLLLFPFVPAQQSIAVITLCCQR